MLSIIFLFSHTRAVRQKWSRSENKRWTFIFSFFTSIFFFPLFSTKILPCINLFFSFILSSHYLYQFPFSSMKQKLTKTGSHFRIRQQQCWDIILLLFYVFMFLYDPITILPNNIWIRINSFLHRFPYLIQIVNRNCEWL